jgi:hypothetical protein
VGKLKAGRLETVRLPHNSLYPSKSYSMHYIIEAEDLRKKFGDVALFKMHGRLIK